MKAATVQQPDCKLAGHISIHAAREGGDGCGSGTRRGMAISIHAAREGGDVKAPAGVPAYKISIHAAREGGDTMLAAVRLGLAYFNPRRP